MSSWFKNMVNEDQFVSYMWMDCYTIGYGVAVALYNF